MSIDLDTFCVAPFNEAMIDKQGELLPCCEWMVDQSQHPAGHIQEFEQWWTQGLQGLRDQFSRNHKDSGCLHCDKKEKIDKSISPRINRNLMAQQPINFYTAQDQQRLENLEIRLGNYCNLRCIMCGEYASSLIASEYEQFQSDYNNIGIFMGTPTRLSWWEDITNLSNARSILSDLRRCSFSGGEPLIVPVLSDILGWLPSDCQLLFTTNLTRISDKVLQSFSRFRSIIINVSLEGVQTHNDYVRYGSRWIDIEQNIQRLKGLKNIRININHVLQHTSVFALPRLIEWSDVHDLNITYQPVYEHSYPAPKVLTINSVQPCHVEMFAQWLQSNPDPVLDSWITQYVFDLQLHNQFRQYVNMLDRIRGCNFDKTFGINI